jgi:hypothetical protein
MNKRERSNDESLSIPRSHVIEQDEDDLVYIHRSNRLYLPNNFSNGTYSGMVPDMIDDEENFSIIGVGADEPDTIDDLLRHDIGMLWQQESFEDAQQHKISQHGIYNEHHDTTGTTTTMSSPNSSDGDHLVSRASCSLQQAPVSSAAPQLAATLLQHEMNTDNTSKMRPVHFSPSFVPRDFLTMERCRNEDRLDLGSITNALNSQQDGNSVPM